MGSQPAVFFGWPVVGSSAVPGRSAHRPGRLGDHAAPLRDVGLRDEAGIELTPDAGRLWPGDPFECPVVGAETISGQSRGIPVRCDLTAGRQGSSAAEIRESRGRPRSGQGRGPGCGRPESFRVVVVQTPDQARPGPGFASKFPDVRPPAGPRAGTLERLDLWPLRSVRG